MFIEFNDFVIVVDTIMIQNLRMIFDMGGIYSDLRLIHFKNIMKEYSFWPDFDTITKPN